MVYQMLLHNGVLFSSLIEFTKKMEKTHVSFGFTKIIGALFIGTVLTEIVYYAIKKIKIHSDKRYPRNGDTISKTIFFPDSKVACKSHFTERHGCTNQRCGFSHDEKTSYGQLLRFLRSARVKMDICIFVLTCADFAEILIDLHNKGVVVRIVTDGEQIGASGSRIGHLRAAGIQVRNNTSSYHMHHKFAIIDGQYLMNGSFNWTRQAITGNHENLFITNSRDLVQDYQGEFDHLWETFGPK